ncbi:MAG: RNA polymerase sigma factor [Candidatus Hydrogenedens sp.]
MNETEFISCIVKYKNELYRYLKRNLKNPSSIDDVFSETIITAFEKRNEFQEGTNFRAWIYKILINKSFIENREKWNHSEPLDKYEEIPSHEQVWKTGNVQIDFEKFLESCSDETYKAFIKLPVLQRLCIYLKDVENFSYTEISEVLSIPYASVMTYLARGRANLRKNLLQQINEKATNEPYNSPKINNAFPKKNIMFFQRSKINAVF